MRSLNCKTAFGSFLPRLASIESVQTADEVMRLAERHGIELPISDLVRRVLHEQITPIEGLKMLLAREQKPEYPEDLFE